MTRSLFLYTKKITVFSILTGIYPPYLFENTAKAFTVKKANANGGYHVGISVIDKETLKDAMINPDKYKSLTVRLYEFSEYFVSLPKWQQLAILNRTEYN